MAFEVESTMMWLLVVGLIGSTAAQFTSQTYPDPRLDPIACRLPFPAHVCDPSSVLTDEERVKLMQRINEFRPVTAGIRNTSPACQNQPEKNLEIFVIVIDKIGSIPGAPVDIEKFANNLKRRFQNYQVFTVAGRDARISKETLRHAFERNVGHFKAGHYAMGLEGMIEMVVATYSNAHIVQVPSPETFTHRPMIPAPVPETPKPVPAPEFRQAPETLAPFRAAGIPNSIQPSGKSSLQPIGMEDVAEEDKVWVGIMQQAVGRCGTQPETLSMNVRAVVEGEKRLCFNL
ncbi:hypothetical protein NECAME_10590 [Necator americanus]|uniref:VWFA domain-containing protein n=1 Tax=Necator americanus TaxID=51031 RepID=W2T872_NECAM|nr:hypothetical protein NECAME_10590 [Necator americanus]ETN78083.1 hypothetical protein NECAME_10590 [Necator americanus]